MRFAVFPIERLALYVIEQYLRLVRSDKEIVALEAIFLIDALAVVRLIGRRHIMVRIFLDTLAVLNSSVIGLAVKPAVVLANAIHIHIGLAEPAHKAVAAVRLAQPLRLC